MKKILFIHHGRGIGGAPTSMSYLAKEMNKNNFNVEVLFLFNSDAIKLFDDIKYHVVGLPLFYFNHTSHWVKLYKLHMIIIQMISWLFTILFVAPYWYLKLKPDAVYLNSSVLTDWSLVAKIFRIKNLVHIREAVSNGHYGVRNKLIKVLLNYSADTILYLSMHNYNRLKTTHNKSFVIPNYVRDMNYDFKLYEKEYDFIYVGGQKEIKGIEIIENFLLEKENNISVILLGYYKSEFIKQYSNIDNVKIVGVVPDAINYIKKSKFLIFPAVTPHFPRPVIEAYSVGTIPIVSNLEGICEIVKDGETGFVFENRNLNSLKQIIEKAKLSPYDLIAKNGFELMKAMFSIENEKKIINSLTLLLENK